MKRTLILIAATLLLAACGTKKGETLAKKGSSGKTLEVLVAADKQVMQGALADLVDSILRAPILTLPQPEPRFSVVHIPLTSLRSTQMFQMHRNIISIDVQDGNPDKTYLLHDEWAEPQVVVEIAARSPESAVAMLRRHQEQIVDAIHATEQQRVERAFNGIRGVELMKRVKDKFGFGLTLSEEFAWARDDGGFAWIRKETKDFSLGLLISTSPYRDEAQFDPSQIMQRQDTLMRRYVPGPTEGSYMGLERRVEPDVRKVDFEGSAYCVEMRGLWRTFGDFMGGPYVSYTLLSPDGKQLVELTGFVYCPRSDRYSKRDLLMQLEGICHSIRF